MLTPISIARSGFIASGAVGWPHVASGAVRSGHVADRATVSGSYASGSVASGHLASGTILPLLSGEVGSGHLASGSVQGFFGATRHVASGTVGVFDFGSGAVVAGAVGSGAVQSGNVASGQVGQFHLASGSVTSGHVGNATIVSGSIGSGQVSSGHFASGTILPNNLTSGAVQSGFIASGAVQGFFGATRHVASGTLGVFDFGSGAVIAGVIGSGAVQSGNIGSGSVGTHHHASGSVMSGHIADGAVVSGSVVSGGIGTAHIASGGLLSGAIGSGQIGNTHLGSGSVLSGHVASGQIGGRHLASGAVRSGHIGDAAVVSGSIGSGQVASGHFASGTILPNNLTSGFVGSGFLASGSVGGFYGVTRHVQSGTVGSTDFASGAVEVGAIGSGAVVSGNIASGQIGLNHIASGAVRSGHIASGQIGYRHVSSGAIGVNAVGSGAVLSGNIASGHVYTPHFSSGATSPFAANVNPFEESVGLLGGLTDERISGCRAVCLDVSGRVLIAMAGLSGRMPAVGVVNQNHEAGERPVIVSVGGVLAASGLNNYSGQIGTVYVGRSGHLVTASGSWNSGGFVSGDVIQPVGVILIDEQSPNYRTRVYVYAGAPRVSGGPHVTTSGAVIAGSIGSGAVVSGNIASGQIGTNHIASGRLTGFELGSGAIVSGRIASGQIGGSHHASGGVTSGAVASGQIGRNHLGSGILGDVRGVNEFRLTIASGNAYPSVSVSGVAVHLVPVSADGTLSGAVGMIGLYDTTVSGWVPFRTSGTIGPTLSGSSGSVYDVYAYNNAGNLAVELSAPWTNATTRADLLKLQDGVPVKSGDVTKRWVGMIGGASSGIIADSLDKRLVANAYNRRQTCLHVCPGYADDNATNSWAWGALNWGPIHSGSVDDRVEFLVPGVNAPFDAVEGCFDIGTNANTRTLRFGIAEDSVTTPARQGYVIGNLSNSLDLKQFSAVGRHTWYMLAVVNASGALILADSDRTGGAASDPQRTFLDVEVVL